MDKGRDTEKARLEDEVTEKQLSTDVGTSDGETAGTATPIQHMDGASTLGAALRSTYQDMVDEAIPPEMLDLLNRLN